MRKFRCKKIFEIFCGLLFLSIACAQNKESIAIELQIPENLKPFIALLEKQQAQLQGGASQLLYRGRVVYKSTQISHSLRDKPPP